MTNKLLGGLKDFLGTAEINNDHEVRTILQHAIAEIESLHTKNAELCAELSAVYRLLRERHMDTSRCPYHPKGERCCLPANHIGPCKWGNGD